MPASTPKDTLWSPPLAIAWVVNFCLAFVFYLLMTTMALYAVEQFDVSDTAGGLAASVFVIGATAARFFAGNLVDLVGRRRVLIISLTIFVIASLSYFLIDSFVFLLAIRAVHGAAFALASTAAMALAQSVIPRSRLGEGTGYFTLSMTLATAVGPLLAVVLRQEGGHDALFGAGALAAVVAMVLALVLRAPQPPLDPAEKARLRRFHPRDLLHPQVLPVAGFMFVMAISYSGVLTYLNSYASEKGLQSGAGIFFLVYAVVLVLTRFVAGPLQDRRGDNVVVYTSIVGFALGLAVLATATTNVVLVVAGGLMGLGFGTLMSTLQVISVGRVPRQRMGVAISTHFFMVDLGMGVGPVVLGLLFARAGFSTMYAALAVVVLLAAALYHVVHGRADRDRRRSVAEVSGSSPEPVEALG